MTTEQIDKTIELLDHGYVTLVEAYGSDERIIEAARMSVGGGFVSWEPYEGHPRGDQGLLEYLYRNNHATPFEMAGAIFEIKAPIMVYREWHRHRTQCLAGDTMIHFQRPDNGRVYKMPIREVWRKWQPTTRNDRPWRQTNGRDRIARMHLRCVDEEMKSVVLTRVVDVVKSDAKQLFSLTTVGGKTIRASADHKFLTNRGWMRLEDAVSSGAMVAVESTAKKLSESWEYDLIDTAKEMWRPVVGWEGFYEVSDMGRVRRKGKPTAKRSTINMQGYPVVSLNRPGIQATATVHRLVLEAWAGPCPSGMEARHLNSNRTDARATNLVWGSSVQNSRDMKLRGSQQSLGVLFEEISSCVPDGVEETYDLSVEGPWHNFIANGCVVHNSYNEQSARYAQLPNENYIPSVERLLINTGKSNKQAGTVKGAGTLTVEDAKDFQDALREVYAEQEELYQQALAAGVPKELARVHLPVGRYSSMRATANLRNWMGFLALRMDTKAQWEIRQYANAVHDLLAEKFPRSMALFDARAS